MKQRPKILLLPGYACDSWIWDELAARLRHRLECVPVDWPAEQAGGFHKVEDFAAWLSASRGELLEEAAGIVGHSMGGLVALKLGQSKLPGLRYVVLLESFLRPPEPFFQSILSEHASESVRRRIGEMMRRNLPRFSVSLREELKAGDYANLAEGPRKNFFAVYGTRTASNPAEVAQRLGWPDRLYHKAALRFIHGCAHFPMLEDPDATAAALDRILAFGR